MKKVLLLLGLLTLPAGAQIIDPPDPSAPLPTWVSLRTAPPATAPLQRPIASAKEVPAWLREVQTLPPDWLQLGHWPAVSTPASRVVAELQRQDSRRARATLQALLEWAPTEAGQLLLLAALRPLEERAEFERRRQRLQLNALVRNDVGESLPVAQWFREIEERLPPAPSEAEAEALLIQAPHLEDRWLGFASRPSPLWAAFNALSNDQRALERLERVFQRAKTPAGQLYALYGLAKVAPERYCALRGRVKAESPVHSWKGDTGMGLTVGFITSYWESNGVKCPSGRQERDRR